MQLEFEGAEPVAGIDVAAEARNAAVRWTITNTTSSVLTPERVALRWRIRPNGRLRMLCNGWQSWSPSGGATVGVDRDLSIADRIPAPVRAAFHADAAAVDEGQLRSEVVTVVADDHEAWCIGFDGGDRHDGTIRVTRDAIVVEAYLGGARLLPGEHRLLHDVRLELGQPATLLDSWARWAANTCGARATAPYQVGWCSWYQYFHDVTEDALRHNLARAGDFPIDVFQLDDGYQRAIGDWLQTAPAFPSPLERIATDIATAGYTPGVWLAPFLVGPESGLAAQHPDWIARRASGDPVIGNINPGWGGETWTLDTTHPEVLAHLEALARTLVEMGWKYLKLDFTYAPSFTGAWHDPARTPAERVRAGYDAIRRGAGDDTFILGCGAPLGACIGVVDGMRIGPDVAPAWDPPAARDGYADAAPSTKNALRNTLARSFLHRRLWLNDPDCVMLRSSDTGLNRAQIETWARVVAESGGMALVSDDLGRLGAAERDLLGEVVAIGRTADADATSGAAPSCPDLLERWTPTRLRSGPSDLQVDPDAGTIVSAG
jgi:alpha-galactosidase